MQILTPPDCRERIGFVVPRWTAETAAEGQGPPFRSLTVASALYNAGYEVVFFDQKLDRDLENRMADFLAALVEVRVVFIWMNDLDPMFQTRYSQQLAGEIKTAYPEIRIVVGGSFLSLCPVEILTPSSVVDFFIRGYGEEACVQLLDALDGGITPKSVSGLVWFEGARHANPITPHQRYRPEYLSLFKRVDLSGYIQKGGIFGNGFSTLIVGTGRGCAKRCSFCYWRNHPPSLLDSETIVELFKWLRSRWGVRQFHMAELDFFTNRRRPRELARLWKERLPDCRWFALVSPLDADKLSDADWDLLAEGGCRKLEFGTESGSPALLERLGKRHRPQAPYEVTRKALARGIDVMHNFIFGFVGETETDRRHSLSLIHALHRLDPEHVFFTFRFFQPTWNTPQGDEAIRWIPGFPRTLEEVIAFREWFGDPGQRTMPWLPPRDEERIKKLAYYYLPMVTSKLEFDPGQVESFLYRGLRRIARYRLRTQKFGLGWDHWLFDRMVAQRLDNTYVP